ncbi:hypothetical protein P171DRAFT_316853, partial [Karstenula rhodostoma CBS 690.94]
MSSLIPARGSVFSAANENYAALANVKFDFSLIKMEAPVEFNGIVSALSTKRRAEAEDGPSHKTARRLGALFEEIVPSTPKLISAYGSRMSEIMNTPDVNDIGTSQHGPFEPYVGADGTSLWAAATSGIPALGVYLLSCLLARAWDATEATAIWMELVAARRKEIEHQLETNQNVPPSSVVGACQDITRKDLAMWDSSARSWLRRADKAKEWSQCQLSLVVKNINTPIAGGLSTYSKVMSVWKRSMLAVEQLLSGKPQDIMDGAVFLAFSAWHIYPDLIVLGAEPKHVRFKDKLVPPSGVGTVGVESRSSRTEGVQWSLALSHLQYYGDPVIVRSDHEYSRLTFSQLQIVALGGLLGAWGISARDFLLVANWFTLLWSRMGFSHDDAEMSGSSEFGWLYQFVSGAKQILATDDPDHERDMILLKHGSRRAKGFLGDQNCNPSPFFGLLNALTMCALQEKLDVDSGITYLRVLAGKLGLRGCDAVICYAHAFASGRTRCFEIAAIHRNGSQTHRRWICPFIEDKSRLSPRTDNDELRSEEDYQQDRVEYIVSQGEECEIHPTGLKVLEAWMQHFSWLDPPSIFLEGIGEDSNEAVHQSKKAKVEMPFNAIVGNWQLGLFLCSEARRNKHDLLQSYIQRATFETAKTEKVSTSIQNFTETKLVPGRLRDYVGSLMSFSKDWRIDYAFEAPGISLMSTAHTFHIDFGKSAYALYSASRIYADLTKATISLKLVARPLCISSWFKSVFERWNPGRSSTRERHPWSTQEPLLVPQQSPRPDRHESFSCIALFDSGIVDINPEEFAFSFALCSEDTIYVPRVVLSDPFADVKEHEIQSITGNIPRPGISILVSPMEPRIRELSDSYNLVNHNPYDFKRENNFKETSLHLSFTDWTFPLATDDARTIDHNVQVVEAVISVRDRGKWVGDINVLEVDFQELLRLKTMPCTMADHTRSRSQNLDYDYTSIDSWEELLDGPNTVGIFRAHGNWAARLAAVSLL